MSPQTCYQSIVQVQALYKTNQWNESTLLKNPPPSAKFIYEATGSNQRGAAIIILTNPFIPYILLSNDGIKLLPQRKKPH
jgi:hypothetical protein